jgi:hypothetical protein
MEAGSTFLDEDADAKQAVILLQLSLASAVRPGNQARQLALKDNELCAMDSNSANRYKLRYCFVRDEFEVKRSANVVRLEDGDTWCDA